MKDNSNNARANDLLILDNIKEIKESQKEINSKLFQKLDDFCVACYQYRETTYKEFNENMHRLELDINRKADQEKLDQLNIELKNKAGIIAIVTIILMAMIELLKTGWKYITKI
ncbi:MAG: hypothetical protein A3K77_00565 [Euryarchaeota archaeon RBG_13_31_8]|nr:MAG: hypothetical protein A3K77_00565 [Euryarchaeota archaeon RBG_13_31_8]